MFSEYLTPLTLPSAQIQISHQGHDMQHSVQFLREDVAVRSTDCTVLCLCCFHGTGVLWHPIAIPSHTFGIRRPQSSTSNSVNCMAEPTWTMRDAPCIDCAVLWISGTCSTDWLKHMDGGHVVHDTILVAEGTCRPCRWVNYWDEFWFRRTQTS